MTTLKQKIGRQVNKCWPRVQFRNKKGWMTSKYVLNLALQIAQNEAHLNDSFQKQLVPFKMIYEAGCEFITTC